MTKKQKSKPHFKNTNTMKTTKQKNRNRIDHRKVVINALKTAGRPLKSLSVMVDGNLARYRIMCLVKNNAIVEAEYRAKVGTFSKWQRPVIIKNMLIIIGQQQPNETAKETAQPTGQVPAQFEYEIHRRESEIERLKKEIERLKSLMGIKLDVSGDMKLINLGLQKEIEQLKKQAEINGKDYAALQAEYVRVSQELKGYQKENGILKSRLNDANDLIDGLQHRPQQATQLTVEPERLQVIAKVFDFYLSTGESEKLTPVLNFYIKTNGNPTLSQIIDALKGGAK